MAFFTAIGVISNDIVRRETKNGVVTTFRLETGAPRGRKLWIDIECWGQLAGTIAHHGGTGRAIHILGILKRATWRDRSTGAERSRLIVLAQDAVLLKRPLPFLPVNQISAVGRMRHLETTEVRGGFVVRFELRSGHARSRAGVLELTCHRWQRMAIPIAEEDYFGVNGSLTFGRERTIILRCQSEHLAEQGVR